MVNNFKQTMSAISYRACLWLAALGLAGNLPCHAAEEGAAQRASDASLAVVAAKPVAAEPKIYATVNGKAITVREYESAFASALRQKFYHGQIPEGQLPAVREEVKTRLVQRVLLLEEAKRRGIEGADKSVDDAIAGYDERYASSATWQQSRERMLPGLRAQLVEQNALKLVESAVKAVPEPSDREVRAYYEGHKELFTEPEKTRLSVILLGVDPSSPKEKWQSAREEAKALHERLLKGADFQEAARMHSSGKEAEQGGDLGYLHRGMLPEALQQRIDKFEIGAVAEPVDVLEGVAIFRLEERVPARLREFKDVILRARELTLRDRQSTAWTVFLDGLVAKADVRMVYQHAVEQKGPERP